MTDSTIILKHTLTPGKAPTTSQLILGELAVNTYDGKIFLKTLKDGVESITTLSEAPSVSSVNGKIGDITLTTSDILEGTNLYYTDSLARSVISATGDLSYNNSTGEFSYTNPSPTITLTGDLSGSVTLTGLGNATLSTTIKSSGVAVVNGLANLPGGVNVGKLALDTSDDTLYIWSGSAWMIVG